MKNAYITTNVLDLWAEPKYNSERVSQLLWCDLVRVGKSRDRFVAVRQPDGYSGWLDHRFLSEISQTRYNHYLKKARWVVVSPQAALASTTNRDQPPHFVYYGTRLLIGRRGARFSKVELPDGGEALIRSSAVREIAASGTAGQILREAKRFLGVPYLWGGVSPAGYDCSGFVRAIFARFGYALPRDTKDQVRVGRQIKREEIHPGDLLFFNRHVGIALAEGRLIHSSVSGGGVRINSLDGERPDYRADLDRDFNQARRVL